MQNYLYFDLETQRSANDVGGWNHKDKMGMSVGVVYSTRDQKYTIYSEDRVQELIDALLKADLVIGFNHIGFDYDVLMAYTIVDLKTQCRSLDLLIDLEKKLGHRLKLDSIAAATLGTGKTADGLEAIRWWQEGKMKEIAEYCCFDVKVTKRVHEYGAQNGFVKFTDRYQGERQVEVDWKVAE